MANRHELSEIEYQCYRTEVLDSLLSWQSDGVDYDASLVIRDRDLESLVSDLTDSIVYRVIEDRQRVAAERRATAPQGILAYSMKIGRFLDAKLLPDYLPPRDHQDWLSIWTRVLFIWYGVLLIVTFNIEGML